MCSIKHIYVTFIQNIKRNRTNLFWIEWIKGRNDEIVIEI